jgi:hypothetical protein
MQHKMDYTKYRIQVQGLEFEVGSRCLLRKLTGFLIRQKHRACLPKSPWKIENTKYRWKLWSKEFKDWSSRRLQVEDLKIWDLTWICDLDRISGLLTRVWLPRPAVLVPLRSVRVEANRNIGPRWRPKYSCSRIWKYIVIHHVWLIYIKPDRILETWPPIKRG